MNRALVIKGADFSMNKLKTVTLVSIKPCTGIEFDEETYSLTDYDTVTVEYTLTPADTTDVVIWESSDPSIVTISDGVITPVGVGTCTITATCGTQTASASVSVALSYIPNWIYAMFGIENAYNCVKVTVPTNYNYIGTTGEEIQATEYTAKGVVGTIDNQPGVKLPSNTARIKISVDSPDLLYNGEVNAIRWAKDEWCGTSAGGAYDDAIKYISSDVYNIRAEGNNPKIFNVPVGADSMFFYVRLASDSSASVEPNTIAENVGLTIEFLPPEE